MLTTNSLFPVESVYLLAIENGLDAIYCSNTGLIIGNLTNDELFAAIEMEYSLNPAAEEEQILDALQLSLIPASSRPSVLFQNMTPSRYQAMANDKPEHMFRFLAGKLMFERWTHLAGLQMTGDKLAWLKTVDISDIDRNRFRICLDTLIRIDAVFSVRKVAIDSELSQEVIRLREEWTGFDEFDSFIFRLEQNNIAKLKTFDPVNQERVTGNKMAIPAMIDSIESYSEQEYIDALEMRKASEIIRQARAENRSHEEILKIKRKFAKQFGSGEIETRRGLQAALSLAEVGGAFDKDLALKLIASYDSTQAASKRQQIMDGRYTGRKINKVSTTQTSEPKIKGAGATQASTNRAKKKYGEFTMSISLGDIDL